MFTVAGSNLFGQWFSDVPILQNFDVVVNKHNPQNFNVNKAKLVHVNWSYNIFELENKFYVSGSWQKKDDQLIAITLPSDCKSSNLVIVGNDYDLIVVDKSLGSIWIMDMEDERKPKRLKLTTEAPITESGQTKKPRIDGTIAKVVTTNHSCIYLTTDGIVYSGVLPSYVNTSHCLGFIHDVQCGYEHFMVLTSSGSVYTWGNGRRLQLGHGDVDNIITPTEVHALAGIKIVKIAAGGWHSLALSDSGDLYAWGWNDTGQLGIKSCENELKSHTLPTVVDLYDESGNTVTINVKSIACGTRHSAIILDDYSVWTTGYNKYGQLGLPTMKYPSINQFKKVYNCKFDSRIVCGPWSTILIDWRFPAIV